MIFQKKLFKVNFQINLTVKVVLIEAKIEPFMSIGSKPKRIKKTLEDALKGYVEG